MKLNILKVGQNFALIFAKLAKVGQKCWSKRRAYDKM